MDERKEGHCISWRAFFPGKRCFEFLVKEVFERERQKVNERLQTDDKV